MNSFDYILIIMVLLLSIRGYANGLKNELINIVGLIGGVYLASRLAPVIADSLNGFLHFRNFDLLKSATFLILFALSWVATGWTRKMLGDTIYEYHNRTKGSKIGGAIVNIMKNLAITSIVVALLASNHKLYDGYIKSIKNSISYQTLENIGKNIITISKNK